MGGRRLTTIARFLLRVWNTGWFALAWLWFYNGLVFGAFRSLGAAVSLLLFFVLYNGCCHMYKAFSFVSSETTEVVVSHAISLFVADAALLAQVILVADDFRVYMFSHHFVNLFPGLALYVLQIAGTSVLVVIYKRYYITHVPPNRTLLLYGSERTVEESLRFERRLLRKYSHLFRFTATLADSDDGFRDELDRCETVVMYDVPTVKRSEIIGECLKRNLPFYYTAGIPAILNMGCEAKHLLDTPLMKYEYAYHNSSRRRLKAILDRLMAAVLLVLFSPVLLITALWIKVKYRGPVLEKEERYTENGRIFRMLRFRSRLREDDREPWTAKRLHLDELPQLINILLGDMSFVGPRPERIDYVDARCRELPEFRYRMSVKGGLTGYAQVFGTADTTPLDRLKLDLLYIENQSLVMDIRLIMLTIRALFR